MKSFYQTLTQTLLSDKTEAQFQALELPPIRCVDVFAGEYNASESFEHFPLPAVFFDYSISYEQDQGRALITLHLCYEEMRDISSVSRNKEEAMKYFDFIDTVYRLTRGLESPNTGKLSLVSEETARAENIVKVHLLHYECSYSARKKPDEGKFIFTRGHDLDLKGKVKLRPFEGLTPQSIFDSDK